MKIPVYAAAAADKELAPSSIERREVGPKDVLIEILYCGICHSDVHQARGEWNNDSCPRCRELLPHAERYDAGTAAGCVSDPAR